LKQQLKNFACGHNELKRGILSLSCTLTELQEKYAETNISDAISAAIKEHLLELTSNLNEYFPPIVASKMWVKNPFTVNTENEEILQLNESEWIH
jgi:hypothetical protein